MNYYALLYELVDDMVTRRVPFREEHLRLAREACDRGELLLAGALSEPVDRALLVFHVDDKSKVESFARRDPYVVNGLARKWEVRPWNIVVGDEAAVSGPNASRANGTILRSWSARTSEEQLPKYVHHFSKTVLPELRRVPGYLGATVSLRRHEDEAEIFVETNWRSLDAVRIFAGPGIENAVVAEETAATLTDFDRRVRHYEVVISDRL
jgi:hypothetical protein